MRSFRKRSLPVLGDHFGQVNHTLAVAPLIVIPSDDLEKVIAHGQGQIGIEDGRLIGAGVVAGNQGQIAVLDDLAHGAIGGTFNDRLDLVDRGGTGRFEHQVDG